jgi:hypothetical protein
MYSIISTALADPIFWVVSVVGYFSISRCLR